ncbi:MAG: hypothetical protein K9M45_05225 [Kiritimatiellales bacterium]|nr:hypothetical protein [Kiritimatiellales bacterium]
MPLIKVQATKDIPPDVIAQLSTVVAETIGKPETYVMVSASKADMMMSGSADDAAFVEVKSIGGLSRTVNHELTIKICGLLNDHLGIPGERVYINFTEVPAAEWGWNNSLFG